ncbi:MAG: protein phosphatase 2C domain-containing protein [Blastocatellia bacterium]
MTETPNITLALYAQTDVGMVRQGNEDNFLILDLSTGTSWIAREEENPALLTYGQGYYGALLAVSDGMGGALAGEVASRMAVETVRDRMLQLQAHDTYGRLTFAERMRLAIEEANLIINDEGTSNPECRGMGATFTSVGVMGDRLYFGQVGDSRAYLVRGNRIIRVTRDQSLVQQLIDMGQLTEDQAENHQYSNVILQALGANNHVDVVVNTLPLRLYDTLLLCSDGLTRKIQTEELADIIQEAPDLKAACAELVRLANERGGEDNITVIVAQFSGAGLRAEVGGEELAPAAVPRPPDTPEMVDLGGEPATTRRIDGAAERTEPQIPRPGAPAATGRRGPTTAVFGRDELDPPETPEPTGRDGPRRTGELPEKPVWDAAGPGGTSAAPAITTPDVFPQPGGTTDTGPAGNPAGQEVPQPGARTDGRIALTPMKLGVILVFLGLLVTGLIVTRGYFQQSKQDFEQSERGLSERRDTLKSDLAQRRSSLEGFHTKISQSIDARKEPLNKTLGEAEEELRRADSLLAENKFEEVKTTIKKIDDLLWQLEQGIKKLTTFLPFRQSEDPTSVL